MAAPAGVKERYRLSIRYVLRFALAVLLGRRRDLGADARGTLAGARPRPRIIDEHNIPEKGPFVFVANHYERPGLKVFWGGMLANTAVYERRPAHRTLRWLMTSEWYGFRLAGLIPVPVWLLRWLFRRIANVYGLVVVPRAAERGVGRAAAMRSILGVLRDSGDPIALFPEGVGEDVLREAMPGVGVFLLSLSKRGVPILPCGIYEEAGVLTTRFGPPFHLDEPETEERRERDALARRQLMAHIGALLPQPMWGPHAPDVQRLLPGPPATGRAADAP
jgi:1-acyl-sn-glycerol-3-phosphate acyltransferase